jgi:CIC family chloride channel protein
MKAVIARGGVLHGATALWTTITSALSIGSGGGAGREGPIVLIGASVGSAIGQVFRMSQDQVRTLTACGAAGGIAAIFNAPIGGVMFALEIILGDFSVRRFSPIVVSAVIATAISRSVLGDHPTFVASEYHLVSNGELGFYLALGLLAGIVSVWFVRTFFAVEGFCGRLTRLPAFLRPAVGGLGVGLMLVLLPQIAGFSYEVNNQAILGEAEPLTLLAVLLLKPVAAGLTLGSGGSGGVFAPALKAGVAFGGLVGFALNVTFPGMTASSGAYALVGMGAVLAGTMHAPLTAIVMIFELSGTYQVILPIMFAAVAATVVSRLLMPHSVYTLPLARQGIEIGYGISMSIVHHVRAADLMRRKFHTVRQATTVFDLLRLVESGHQTVFPVTDDQYRATGVVRFQDLRTVIPRTELHRTLVAEDIMVRDFDPILEDHTLDTVLRTFELTDADELPVLAAPDGRVVGMLRYEDALRRYRREVLLAARR